VEDALAPLGVGLEVRARSRLLGGFFEMYLRWWRRGMRVRLVRTVGIMMGSEVFRVDGGERIVGMRLIWGRELLIFDERVGRVRFDAWTIVD
jgi:hypothetical protein